MTRDALLPRRASRTTREHTRQEHVTTHITYRSIDFAEFLKVIENQKDRAENFDDENDMIDAFVACGGRPDKAGHVRRETLVKIIKHDFGLTIDIEELINKIDTDLSGEIEFEEFKALLS